MYALLEDFLYSLKISKTGWVKGVGAASRSNPRHNLTGDPYFTAGLRAVLVFGHRPHSFDEIQNLDWEESAVSSKLKRLTIDQQQDFDE
jgi:hypothetical protein